MGYRGVFSLTKWVKSGSILCMKILLISQAVVALLLSVSVLLQNRGSGLGGAFGGDFGSYYAKRGLEKFLLYATIFLAVLFIVLSILSARYTAV